MRQKRGEPSQVGGDIVPFCQTTAMIDSVLDDCAAKDFLRLFFSKRADHFVIDRFDDVRFDTAKFEDRQVFHGGSLSLK